MQETRRWSRLCSKFLPGQREHTLNISEFAWNVAVFVTIGGCCDEICGVSARFEDSGSNARFSADPCTSSRANRFGGRETPLSLRVFLFCLSTAPFVLAMVVCVCDWADWSGQYQSHWLD